MGVAVAAVYARMPELLTAFQDDSIINDNIQASKEYADEALVSMNDLIDDLKESLHVLSIDTGILSQLTLSGTGPVIDEVIDTIPAVTITPANIDPVSKPTLDTPSISTVTVPDVGSTFTANFAYSEPVYNSALLGLLKTTVTNFLAVDSSGIGTAAEAALWARSLARVEAAYETSYDNALSYFSSRGFVLPPGALSGKLLEIDKEHTRSVDQFNFEQTIEHARLIQSNNVKMIECASVLENFLLQYQNNANNRLLETAKTSVLVAIDIFKSNIEFYRLNIERAKIISDIDRIRASIVLDLNKSKIDMYTADIDKFKADVQKDLSLIESQVKLYGLSISIVDTKIKAKSSINAARIDAYKAGLEFTKLAEEVALKQIELALQSYLKRADIISGTSKDLATLYAQVAAGALSSIHTSATRSSSTGRSYNAAVQHQTSVSGSVSESYNTTTTIPSGGA